MSDVIRGFNGDTFIKIELDKLCRKFNVKTIVETGTFHGGTTLEFCSLVDKVFTIEINETYYNNANAEFIKHKLPITSIKGTSPVEMEKIIKNVYGKFEKPALFYLDAHWHKYNPLLDELGVISRNKLNNCLIAIHDFKVPDKDFGFDKFSDGSEYTFEFIKKSIERIYGVDGYSYHYNEQADGAKRGIIFIYPKQ
jgi:cephalosporin hydroxylase